MPPQPGCANATTWVTTCSSLPNTLSELALPQCVTLGSPNLLFD